MEIIDKLEGIKTKWEIILGPEEKIIACQAKSLIPADFHSFSNRIIL